MKHMKLLYVITIFLCTFLQAIPDQMKSITIFTPIPLLELDQKNTPKLDYIAYIKDASLLFACCFCLSIKKNDIWTDIIQNPKTTIALFYCIVHYYAYLMMEQQQQKIDRDIIHMMQNVFHLLIIGHGIYNKIALINLDEKRMSNSLHRSNINSLELFLCNAYQTWLILFSYYQDHYKNNPLYAYDMEKIDTFEILQAADYEPDMLPLITSIYDKKNKICDYEPILKCLEIKLKQINHKLITILPS
jgi:hypothetical protein